MTGITSTGRANFDKAHTANEDGVIDVFAQDDFRDVQVALEKVRAVLVGLECPFFNDAHT